MKLNKKVTAMAMAVMMAVSSVPMAYAEEAMMTETSEGQLVEVAANTEEPSAPAEEKIYDWRITQDGVVQIKKQPGGDDKWEDTDYEATEERVEPTCQADGKVYYTFTLGSETKTSDPVILLKVDHKGTWDQVIYDPAPTCDEKGTSFAAGTCEMCGELVKKPGDQGTEVAELGHQLKETILEYKAGENTKIENGKPVLINPTLDGEYTYMYVGVCEKCGHKEETPKESAKQTIKATQLAGARIGKGEGQLVNIKAKTIADLEAKHSIDWFTKEENLNTIPLDNCKKDASLIIEWLDGKGGVATSKKYTIAAHHTMGKIFEAVDSKDQKNLYMDEETETVMSKICSKDIEYYAGTGCTVENCKEKTIDKSVKLVAKANADAHRVVNTDLYNQIKKASKEGVFTDKAGKTDEVTYKDLKGLADENKSDMTLTAGGSCTTGGTCTVVLNCGYCGTPAETFEVKVPAWEHDPEVNATIEKKDATCEEAGYVVIADKCKICGELLSEEVKKPVARLAHTNELTVSGGVCTAWKAPDETTTIKFAGGKVVDTEGETLDLAKDYDFMLDNKFEGTVGLSKAYGVTPSVYTNCKVCGNNEVNLTKEQNLKLTSLKLVSIEAQHEDLTAGEITLKATYAGAKDKDGKEVEVVSEVTFPYYDTLEGYFNRKEEGPKNGLVEEDGKFVYYVDGKIDTEFLGVVEYEGSKFVVAHGEVATNVSGLWQNPATKEWNYYAKGQLQNVTQLVQYDGAWFFVTNGKMDTNVGGLVEYDGRQFVVAKGQLKKNVSGLWQAAEGAWYYVAQGQVTDKTTLVQYDGAWFYVVDGKLASDFTGTVEYDGAKFKVVNGQVVA